MRSCSPDPPRAVQTSEFSSVKDVGEFGLAVARPGTAGELVHVGELDAAFWGIGVAHGGYVYDAHAAGVDAWGRRSGEEEGR